MKNIARIIFTTRRAMRRAILLLVPVRVGLYILSFLIICSCVGYSSVSQLAVKPNPENRITPVLNRQYLPTLINLIKSAKKEIYVVHMTFSNDLATQQIKDSLLDAASRKVKIKILLENKIEANKDMVDFFNLNDIPSKLDLPRKFLHTKLVIVDEMFTLIGSTNLTYKALKENNETNVLIADSEIAKFYKNYSDQLFNDSSVNPRIAPLNYLNIEPLVNRMYFDRIEHLFLKAKSKIGIIMYNMKYYPKNPKNKVNRLLKILIDKKQSGVEVKVILEKSDYNKTVNRDNLKTKKYLEKNGIEIKFDSPGIITHPKLILVDDAVVIGSHNWTWKAIHSNHETSIIISDKKIASQYWDYFNCLWLWFSE